MRSGDADLDRTDDYYRSRFQEIIDKDFDQVVFSNFPGLISKKLVNGHRMWKPYKGGNYTQEEFDLIEDMWDHEHCSLCDFKIMDGHTYWHNADGIELICDECREHFLPA